MRQVSLTFGFRSRLVSVYIIMLKNKASSKKFLQGIAKRHPDGFGFFIPDDATHPDVYLPKNTMTGVMTNDKVMVEVFPEKGTQRYYGDVMKIISRSLKKVVGKFVIMPSGKGYITDDSKSWGSDLFIAPQNTMHAQNGQLVAAEIINYPSENEKFEGRIVEIIGDALNPLNDIKRILFSHNIPQDFSKETLIEASRIGEHVNEKDFHGRRDLRDLDLITIDGATAKDFDDAVFCETNNEGFHIYVAIADVSHYVQVGSAIDKDAYERGTSVYFPNFVVPMLPEALSNELCSLKPNVPRLSLVAEIQTDFTGQTIRAEFYEAVIQSKARVTYGEAQEFIDGTASDELKQKLGHVESTILKCADVSKVLMAKRFKEGSLDLEIPETELEIDASGVPVDVIKSERLFAHRLIEELMLIANVEVAKFLGSKEIPSVYRIHDLPRAEAIKMLDQYLFNFGGRVRLVGDQLQKKLTRALTEFEGKPESIVLHILTLRSMAQAKYSTENIGHFGLGFEFYTHFTSPIRRYPDLIVHRLVKNQIMQGSKYRLVPHEDLSAQLTFLSGCEQRSVKAERHLQSIKKARFMEKLIGQEFDGIISSVAKFGAFILLRQFDIDGLIHVDNLKDDHYEYDEVHLMLKGRKTGRVFAIGDSIKIKVTGVNIDAGQIDFELSDELKKQSNQDKKKSHVQQHQQKNQKLDHGKKGQKFDKNKRDENRTKNKGNQRFGKRNKNQDQSSEEYQHNNKFDRNKKLKTEREPVKEFQKSKKLTLLELLEQKKKENARASHKEQGSVSDNNRKANRKDSQKRRSDEDDRGGFRKARTSQRSRKNKAR